MKVQTRILLLLLGIVAAFLGGLAALKQAQQQRFRQIAAQRATDRNAIFDQFLSDRGDNLNVLVEDSSVWDDMVLAILKNDVPWLEQHIGDDSLVTYKANAAWVYKPDGTLLFSRNNRYADNLKELPVPTDAVADRLFTHHLCHFFARVPQGWMEIRGATIHPSHDRFRETTPQGYFFAGHIWMDDSIRRMAMFTGYSIRIVPPTEILEQRPSDEEHGLITFSRILPGWDGKPAAQILVQHDSPIIRELNTASQRLFLYLIFFSIGLLLVLAFSLIRWVRRPLRLISTSLERDTPEQLVSLERESTEFGRLAGLILRSRQTEAELRNTEELLRHSQKLEAVGRLAGGVAHDFNNLLTAIIGYAQLLELKLTSDRDAQEQAGLIRKAGEQAASLTRQLLAFSRKQLLKPVVLDLNALLVDMEKLLRRVIGEHISIRLEPSKEEARVLADPTQLEQVILNLGVNARDAMPSGGTLTISTSTTYLGDRDIVNDETPMPPGRYVQLCVSDTGSGMDRETQSRIFEPFFTTKGPGKGTGLGLATVYGIVKQSGGGISVESVLGKGSTFCIYLPQTSAAPEVAEPEKPALERVQSGETILILEDEEVVRDLLTAVLSDTGYQVLAAAAPSEAIDLVSRYSGKIDLLVSDVILPEMHGPVVARQLLEKQPAMRVLYVSGYSENDISDQGVLDAGVEVLQKPFTHQALVRKVRAILDERRPLQS